jgi:hypothetical protein
VILEIDGGFSMSLGFPQADSGIDQERAAQRPFAGRWRDLADDVQMEQSGDEVWFQSDRRDVLEELLRRASAARLVG